MESGRTGHRGHHVTSHVDLVSTHVSGLALILHQLTWDWIAKAKTLIQNHVSDHNVQVYLHLIKMLRLFNCFIEF